MWELGNEIQDEANIILRLLRHHELKHVLFELHNCWLNDINHCVSPCQLKIKAMFDEACNYHAPKKVTPLHYSHILIQEMQLLNDGFNQHNHVFRLFLMQILWADQHDSLDFYPHEVNKMEEWLWPSWEIIFYMIKKCMFLNKSKY